MDKATTAILNNADMVFSTLAFSGGSLFRKVTVPFDTLVIDEAAQALEPSCLVPLAASIKQVRALLLSLHIQRKNASQGASTRARLCVPLQWLG